MTKVLPRSRGLHGKDLSQGRVLLLFQRSSSRHDATGRSNRLTGCSMALEQSPTERTDEGGAEASSVELSINGERHALAIEPRVTLLDALRERLRLTGAKKGCDHGQCGACTVLINGRRVNSCLTLAVMHDGDEITTIEGLGTAQRLHPLQAAFLAHDGFQCGYCTPGQICSAVGMFDEVERGWPSHATADVASPEIELSDAEIRERMSGNICRCAAYPMILAAIRDVAGDAA